MGVRGRKPQIVQDHDNRPSVGRQCTRDGEDGFLVADVEGDTKPGPPSIGTALVGLLIAAVVAGGPAVAASRRRTAEDAEGAKV